MEPKIPQVRNSDIPFYPYALERGQRSEKALTISVAEMYLQGVSTRRVTHILEALCGAAIKLQGDKKLLPKKQKERRRINP